MVARTPGGARAARSARRSASLLALAAPAVLLTAAPAHAIDDPARPDARVTHGPSCRPGGVVVEVVGGTEPHVVVLATTRAPDGEDSAEVRAGQTVVLRTGAVAWGETIDPWLEVAPADRSRPAAVDDLEGFSFTRPAEEDCAAITAPGAPASVPFEPPAADAGAPPAPGTAPVTDGEAGADAPSAGAREVPPSPGAPAEVATAPASSNRSPSPLPALAASVVLGAAGAGMIALLLRARQRRSSAGGGEPAGGR